MLLCICWTLNDIFAISNVYDGNMTDVFSTAAPKWSKNILLMLIVWIVALVYCCSLVFIKCCVQALIVLFSLTVTLEIVFIISANDASTLTLCLVGTPCE